MTGYYSSKPIKTSPVLVGEREWQETEPLLLEDNEVSEEARSPFPYLHGKDTSFLPPTEQRTPEDEQDRPMMYHVIGIARGIQKWFKDLPLPARIILAILALYVLALLENMLVQLVIMSMGLIYTILGILASAIVIYEFFIKRQH